MMKTLEYTVSFTTPAFLGNAEQQAQWRTPPFKALLRQWWRVAYAADRGFNVDVGAMRREEGLLFGHAWLEKDTFKRDGREVTAVARKSLVRLRLKNPTGDNENSWRIGSQKGVDPLSNGLETSYAWFGLIKRGDGLPDRSAVKSVDRKSVGAAEAIRQLGIAVPDKDVTKFQEVMQLIDAFGLIGSRSRGGWGALHVGDIEPLSSQGMARYARSIDACLADDWAASLAKDDGGICIWHSRNSFGTWDKAMEAVAIERKKIRSALKVELDLRPALGFASSGRMPSPLRWKVTGGQSNGLAFRVFAMPHRLPDASNKSLRCEQLQRAWRIVCDTLDRSQSFTPRNNR